MRQQCSEPFRRCHDGGTAQPVRPKLLERPVQCPALGRGGASATRAGPPGSTAPFVPCALAAPGPLHGADAHFARALPATLAAGSSGAGRLRLEIEKFPKRDAEGAAEFQERARFRIRHAVLDLLDRFPREPVVLEVVLPEASSRAKSAYTVSQAALELA